MCVGCWSKDIDYGEGLVVVSGFLEMFVWFKDNCDFGNIVLGLCVIGMSIDEVVGIMGGNWYCFFVDNFGLQG